MTPGTENERGGEGTRSSRRSARRRIPPTSPTTPTTPTTTPQPAAGAGESTTSGPSSRAGGKRRGSAGDSGSAATLPPTRPTPRGRRARAPTTDQSAFPPEEVIDEAAPSAPRVPISVAHEAAGAEAEHATSSGQAAHRGRESRRTAHSNALGVLIEASFADPNTPVHSYSELERRSHISREALSRYVTPRADRRRSPTIETLATIAEAMHLSLEQICRAAAASSRGAALPANAEQRVRDEVAGPLLAALTDQEFAAVVELLRQMQLRPLPET